jgi:hypothetical protein
LSDFVPWQKRSVENAAHYLKMKREVNNRYYASNTAKFRTKEMLYRGKLKSATLSLQFLPQIEEFYKEARRLTEETGVNYVVDHYWPINGKGSCGLHVPWNLRVITQSENDSKGNKEPEDTWSLVTTEQET